MKPSSCSAGAESVVDESASDRGPPREAVLVPDRAMRSGKAADRFRAERKRGQRPRFTRSTDADADPAASAAPAARGLDVPSSTPRAPARVRLAAPDLSEPSLRESGKHGG